MCNENMSFFLVLIMNMSLNTYPELIFILSLNSSQVGDPNVKQVALIRREIPS